MFFRANRANRGNFFRFGRISSIVQPKNLLIWGNFAQIERNAPEILIDLFCETAIPKADE
jgi:hypothetical protein